MSQTTNALPEAGYIVEISTNGSTWTDVSGSNTTVENGGGEMGVAESHTAEGREAIVKSTGKVSPRELKFKSLYTDTSGESFALLWAIFISATPNVYVRYSPAGGAASTKRFVTAVGGSAAAVPMSTCTPPDGDANGDGLMLFEWGVKTPDVLQETIAS